MAEDVIPEDAEGVEGKQLQLEKMVNTLANEYRLVKKKCLGWLKACCTKQENINNQTNNIQCKAPAEGAFLFKKVWINVFNQCIK